ncbi:MAG: dipeptidase [Steroidobacteraceae bacterium]
MNRRIFIGAVGTIGAALGAGAALPREAQQAPLNPQAGGAGASGDRIEKLVKSAPFVNASDVTTVSRMSGLAPGPCFNARYIDRLKTGGVTLVNASVVFWLYDDFDKAPERVYDFYQLLEQHSNDLQMVWRYEDIERARREGKIAILMHAHTPSIMGSDLRRLYVLEKVGVRAMGLSHFQSSVLAEGPGDVGAVDGGLTHMGKDTVQTMNKLHMLVDLAHASDGSKLDACEVSRDPVLVSHTACRAIAPHEDPVVNNRNISDATIQAVAKNGGVIGIMALTHHAVAEKNYKRAAMMIAPYVDHIEHVIKVAGVDFVGIGTETGYVDPSMAGYPQAVDEDTRETLGDNTPVLESYAQGARMPKGTPRVITGMGDMGEAKRNLIVELIARGRSDEEIHKILGGNMLRVYRRVLEGA